MRIEIWSLCTRSSVVKFTLNSPSVPSIMSNVDVKLMGKLYLFCDCSELTPERVKTYFHVPYPTLLKVPDMLLRVIFVILSMVILIFPLLILVLY